eukprot:TRINITY_DN535_c0_g2_i1.p1 TRINITY_DN535_c0_g2~~TRINITY_DN535_c0_g2_i1.p1  ORF type:complete len:409 (-),score=120.22 TRINITY_DN535_c0_g2_i1:110-1336(-)
MFKSLLKKVSDTTDKLSTNLKGAVDNIKGTLEEIQALQMGAYNKALEEIPVIPQIGIPNLSRPVLSVPSISVPSIPIVNTLKESTSALSSSLSTLSSSPSFIPHPSQYRDNVDISAGMTLIHYYQMTFRSLHDNNASLAIRAELVDTQKLAPALKISANAYDMWKKMDNEMARLHEVSIMIGNVRGQVDQVVQMIDDLEGILSQQIEKNIQEQHVAWMEKQQLEVVRYEEKKKKEVANYEQELVIQRERSQRDRIAKERLRLQTEESERRKQSEEAQREARKEAQRKLTEERKKREADKKKQEKLRTALDNAFKKDMEDFKALGPLPLSSAEVVPLENINPISEEDSSKLEEFLGEEAEAKKEIESENKAEKIVDEPTSDSEAKISEKTEELVDSPQQNGEEEEAAKE